jgi:lysophospholipid acyltransferase 5
MDTLSDATGVAEPALRLLLALLMMYPLSVLYSRFCSGAQQKQLFSAVTGLSLIWFNYGFEAYHAVVTTLATWIFISFLPRNVMLPVAFVFNFAYLLIGYYFYATDSYDINWTLPQCVLCLRLIGLAFDVSDGGTPDKDLVSDQKENAIRRVPDLLEMCGYCWFFTSVLTGWSCAMRCAILSAVLTMQDLNFH